MSEWITDRRPTAEDAPYGRVWVTQFGVVLLTDWENINDREPWMPIVPPEPYVKPKRWTAVYSAGYGKWCIYDCQASVYRGLLYALVRNDDEHRQAAERIADIYEEVMP